MGFKENLKSELTFQDMLVKELSAKTGISKRTLDNYLRDNPANPTVENAVKIARALGVSVEYLVTGEKSFYIGKLEKLPFRKFFRGSCELQVAIIARLTTSHFQSCL